MKQQHNMWCGAHISNSPSALVPKGCYQDKGNLKFNKNYTLFLLRRQDKGCLIDYDQSLA
jgi:hypothetical protein